ncbi:MAG: DUF3093 domain-containing protein [Nocardioidaceae bacterium]
MSQKPSPTAPTYDERLGVPLRWWALATMFLATVLVAFLVATPTWLAWTVTGVLVALTGGLFLGYGAARLSVRDGVFRAGRAQVPVRLVGEATALDRAETRRLAGVEADARAYLLLRPYLRRAVRVDIADPADPTPYWLVASRRPAQLVAVLSAARSAGDVAQ